ncbi:MAG TPA: hypothetical protein VNI01_16540, partial [Elusimicrobiota bacterium]|nr:hypothetical protein [Elusimicrobiota bacterium]
APVVNSLAAATHALQESHRVRSLKKDDDLFLHLRESLRKALEGLDKTRFVVLPALKDQEAGAWLAPEALAGRRPVVLDSRLWDFDPATVGGEPLPGSGKSLWSADLARPFVRLGERLLLFGRAAEQFYRSRSLLGQAPVLLNLILGAWLGYGDRPPAEAALGPNPFFSSADVARLVEAMLLDVRGAKPTDAESPRALLEKLAALPPSAQALAAPLIRRSLDSGVLPLELGLQLDRIAAALRLLPHMPPETIATESPLAPNMSRAGGRTFTTIRSEGRESLYELRGAEKIPIAGLQEKTGIRSIVRQGGRYWVTVGYGGESRLYQIRGTRASPVPGLPGANSFDEKGGRLFARVIHPDTTDTIYEILPEQAVPIQGLENLVNAYTPAPAGGRLWAKAQTASDRWTLFEVRDRQAFPVPELRDKTEIGSIVTQDGRVFVEVQEDEEQSLLELKGSSWLPVPGLARRPLGSMIGPLEIGGRLWVGLDDADGLRSYFELKGDALLPVAGLQKVAARGLLPGPGGEAWIALPREDGRQSYHAIRGLALEPVPGLEAKVSFGVPHIAGGRAFVHAAEEKADSRTLYELRDGRAAAVPGLSGKKSITPRHVAGRVFFVTEEQDGTNLLYESSEGRARRIPGVSSFPNFLETGHGRILLHTTKDGIHTVSSLEEEGAVVVPGLEKLTSFDAPEAAGRHML